MTQQDDYLVDCILCNQQLAEVKEALAETRETLALTNDTIRIALVTTGYTQAYVHAMSKFERASAILDMAQEYASILPINAEEAWEYDEVCDTCQECMRGDYKHTRIIDGELSEAVAWERVDNEGEGL